jgi:uncharacterized phage protein (TIGR02218 family)
MTKTIPAELQKHYDGEELTTATCLKLKTNNGLIVLGFTDLDKDIPFNVADGDGEVIYRALFGYDRSNVESKLGMSVDNVEANFILNDVGISAQDMRAGLWDDAEIKIFTLNYETLTMGHIKVRRGNIGSVTLLDDDMGVAEVRGMFQRLQRSMLQVVSPDCRVDLGAVATCKVRVDPPFWAPSTVVTARLDFVAETGDVVKPSNFNDRHFKCTTGGTTGTAEPSWNLTLGGTTNDNGVIWTTEQALTIETSIATVLNQREITLTYTGDAPGSTTPVSKGGTGNLLNEGKVTWISGPNRGDQEEIKEWDLSGKRIKLQLNMPKPITVGDVLVINAGCNKLFDICLGTFNNSTNFHGEDKVPGQNVTLDFPNANQ